MKKYKKTELLKMVEALIKANNMIIKGTKINPDSVIETLTICQESAIMIGEYIEVLDNKYQGLVSILEKYCEDLYQIGLNLSDEFFCKKIVKKITKELMELKHGIQFELPDDRKEVVFLPYKASMWDSLESVWKVAEEDANTDAYVIPIPYFDKNPDGSLRKMYYEGEQYPDYVPITKYDEYDFEERRPDAIYIHNPYDAQNHVTTVHPFFYSKNLKQYTEKLIYIPYFVLMERELENKQAVENMKCFCLTPGVLNADKVIVQSENMRQIYINVLSEAMGNEKKVRKYWEAKIEGSGSPKLDKVANTSAKDIVIPQEWQNIITKSDGTKKKIIFYNNTVAALLQNGEDMIAKMKSVFGIFKRYKDEITLLWRPHPLIESTLTSMRPELWGAYQEMKDEYLKAAWGIYDDTPDIDRAIIISDAYYGDRSSVVELYRRTGKCIMIQDINV